MREYQQIALSDLQGYGPPWLRLICANATCSSWSLLLSSMNREEAAQGQHCDPINNLARWP